MGGVTIDSADPRALAGFWTAALGLRILADYGGEFVQLGQEGSAAPYVGLQRVPEPRSGKNRVHLDLHADDQAAEVARLTGLGATVLAEHSVPGLSWTVLSDPEGNEFCVGTPHS